MKLLFLILLALAVSCHGMNLDGVQMFQRNLTVPKMGKIWDGQNAQPGQFPYQAWLNKIPRRSQEALSTFDYARATVSGFGGTANGLPDILQFTTMIALTNEECNRYYTGNFIDWNKMCARGDPNQRSGICGGDSGGPLVVYENNEAVQIGISIVGLGGCDSGYPNGFTRVAAYLDWISHETGLQIRN
ncbi:unnamed protein product [Diamesa serratosioi]